jgi:predicted membrane channel-forming protein YqfA (hemolysin III family)
MTHLIKSQHRRQTLGEEIANSVSHGIGFLAAVAAAPILVYAAVPRDSAAGFAGSACHFIAVLKDAA